MILKIIKTNPEWLEATWSQEVITSVIDKDVDGQIVEEEIENVDIQIVHCESFSGHPEHIQMLNDKCIEFGTETTVEQEQIITEVKEAFVPTPQEELDRLTKEQKVQEAKNYLASTDWIVTKLNEYKLLVIDIIPLLDKYSAELAKREECRQIQNELNV